MDTPLRGNRDTGGVGLALRPSHRAWNVASHASSRDPPSHCRSDGIR